MKTKVVSLLMCVVLTGFASNCQAQANKQLSNLASQTAVNLDLLPQNTNAIRLGSRRKQWKSLYLQDSLFMNGWLTIKIPFGSNFFAGPRAGGGAPKAIGFHNTAVGMDALYWVDKGEDNTAIGSETMLFNTSGSDNTAMGYSALSSTTGSENTAIGTIALGNSTTGAGNTAVGYFAGGGITTGMGNTLIGYNATCGADLTYATAIGNSAYASASNTVIIGSSGTTSIGGYVNWSNISDGRVKKNIKNNVPGLAFINKLTPITYNLDLNAADRILQRPVDKALQTRNGKTVQPSHEKPEEMAARKAKEQTVYTGFVAQEVEKAAKELNYDFSGVDAAKNDKDLYALRYADFVVPLVKAVQELSKKNDDKDVLINQLTDRIAKLETLMNVKQSGVNLTSASLEQNTPNPFGSSTTITYALPDAHSSAKIVVTDNNGRTIKTINISGNIKGSIQVDASGLSVGTYQYSLYVNQKLITSKQMIVSK